jgi:hypothetical protein
LVIADLSLQLLTTSMDEFEQARDAFLAQVSDEEKAQFAQVKSTKDFLEGIKEFEQYAKNKKKWAKVLRGVQKCSEKLEPYFAVLGIFVSSHPEWAAIAWGAFRLVLQVSRCLSDTNEG